MALDYSFSRRFRTAVGFIRAPHRALVVILLFSTLLLSSKYASLTKADPANYHADGQLKDSSWVSGMVTGYVGCENVPFRIICTFGNSEQGQTISLTVFSNSYDSAGNRGVDYMLDFSFSDPNSVIATGPTIDGHAFPWAGGPGTGTLSHPPPYPPAADLSHTVTFTLKSTYSGNNDVTFYWKSHLALSPNGAAEWIGPPTANIQSGAGPQGNVKTVNIKKPDNAIVSTTTTFTSSTTSTIYLGTTSTLTTSTTAATSWTSVTNPTTTRTLATMTYTYGCQSTTNTNATTYTTSWTRSTTTQLAGSSSTAMTVTSSTLTTATLTTTTFTTVYTITGSATEGTVYMTVVTRYGVRVNWLEQIISGVMTWITQIYRLIFEIKVDPTVDQTIVVVSPTCSTTTTTATSTASITTHLTGSTTVFTTTYTTTITSGTTTYTTTVTTLTTSTYGTRQLGSGYVGGVAETYNPLTTLWPFIVLAGGGATSIVVNIRKRK